tara:strand:+ start:1792 stop:2127 length:336 start_codon:yes stop_codon:yes gene_type:complete
MPRNNKRKTMINDSEYYEPLRKSRNVKRIKQYETAILHNPTVAQRASVMTTKHIWTYGDRLYTLAHKYYGDSQFWWVIAWWNGYGVEAQIKTGAVLYIPIDISKAMKALGV